MKARPTQQMLKCVRTLTLICCATISIAGYAEDANSTKAGLRMAVLSDLPEGISYYDQGFADFIRESKLVPIRGVSIAETMEKVSVMAFSEAGYEPSIITLPESLQQVHSDLSAERKSRSFGTPDAERIKSALHHLKEANAADAVIVVSPGKTSGERFIEGLAVMTKIGLIGITKLSVVFVMPRVEIYSVAGERRCTDLIPVSRKELPAIYSDWKKDMIDGPSEKVASEMQTMVLGELPKLVSDAVKRSAPRWTDCLHTTS